jgi:hypothetical protein
MVHFPQLCRILDATERSPRRRSSGFKHQEKNHNIKTYDINNSVWLYNFVSCDILSRDNHYQMFFVWEEVLWSVCMCVRDQRLSSIMTSVTSGYFSSLSLVTVCVVSFCFTHVKDKTTFWYITPLEKQCHNSEKTLILSYAHRRYAWDHIYLVE